jgi:V/A-type H+-transporting ATPase subunit I
MLFPTEMERLNIAFLSEDRERVVEKLQEQGIVEIKEMPDKGDFLNSVNIDIDHLSSLFLRSEKIHKDFLDKVKKQGFFETLLGNRYEKPVSIKKNEMEDVLRDAEKVVKHAEMKIDKLGKESEENRKLMLNKKSEIEVLEDLKGFDFDLGLLASLRKTFAVIGNVKADVLPVLKTELANFRVYLYPEGMETGENVVLVLGLKTEEEDARKLLVKHDFGFFELGGMKGKPSKILRESQKEMEWLEKKRDYLFKKRMDFIGEWREEIERTYLVLNAYKDRMKSLQMFQETRYVSVLEGWIPKKHEWKVQEALYSATSGRVFFTFEEAEDAPTDLENPSLLEKFEVVTGGFGLPKYKDADPTVFLALLFPIFFGFMLSDVLYGSIILLLSLSMKFYFRNRLADIFSYILLLCGISAIFWGILFGNFLGNFLGFQGLWFNPIQNPVMLIVISLVFGLVHVNMGILISIVQKLRNKESTIQELSWFLVEAGGLLIIFRMFGVVTEVLFYAGLLVFFAGAGIKALKPIQSIGMISFFGNILSYVRLAAISLATSYIALTVNHVSSIFVSGSFILSGFIFTAGHLFNCAISSVGAFINSLRLHYVEFFSRFFEGGGKEFRPLKYEGIEVK